MRALIVLLLLLTLPAAAAPKLAILLVGKRADQPTPAENELRLRLKELLAEVGKAQTQTFRYHFDRPVEKKHCETKLNIKASELLFVGVVELDSRGAVTKVLFRHPRADRNIEVAAQETVYQWRLRSGLIKPQD